MKSSTWLKEREPFKGEKMCAILRKSGDLQNVEVFTTIQEVWRPDFVGFENFLWKFVDRWCKFFSRRPEKSVHYAPLTATWAVRAK